MVSPVILQLCRAVKNSGGRALLVGGWVRDFVRGYETVDYDLEVYGLEVGKLYELLRSMGHVNTVGEAFTVYKVRLKDSGENFVVDVSLPRRESKTGRGHKGFVIEGDPHMSYEEAARRRDFTINSIMYDPLNEEFIDLYNGRSDLERGIIRVVDPETFIEDSLRVLRGMQFASRFGFEIEAKTLELCRTIDLSDLPSERIWAEVEKWLMQSEKPSIGLYAARDLGIVDRLWPEIRDLIDCAQPAETHPEGDAFTHTAMVLDQARRLTGDLPGPQRLAVMLAALCHDFGKPVSTKKVGEVITVADHRQAGVVRTKQFLKRLKVFSINSYNIRGQVPALVGHHLIPEDWYKARTGTKPVQDGDFRRLALKVEPGLLARVELANRLGRGGNPDTAAEDWFFERVRELGVEERAPEPILKGRHLLELGLSEGPRVGKIIKAVYEKQLDGDIVDLDQAKAYALTLLGR